MNKILVAEVKPQQNDKKQFYVEFKNASDILPILRSDYFVSFEINLPNQVNNSQLRFLMNVTRLITKQGEVVLKGNKESVSKTKTIIKNMGLYLGHESQQEVHFTKNKIEIKQQDQRKQTKIKLGFKNIEDEQIDEDELLKDQKIDLNKAPTSCGQKIRACANCTCGLKKLEQLPSKQEIVKSVNEGKPVSGCGKCYLGDSFRCATCPYKGMPAFKPGDKLKLVDDSNVVVESSTAVINNGKVKIEL